MKTDIQTFTEDTLRASLENKTSLKSAKRKLTIGKKQIIALGGNDSRFTEKEEVLKFIRDFYSNLYSNPTENLSVSKLNDVPSVPNILPSEVKSALDSMKKGTVPGDDELSIDILKVAGEVPRDKKFQITQHLQTAAHRNDGNKNISNIQTTLPAAFCASRSNTRDQR
ncbi:uncharacterized protein LOC126335856 [Schistocerca gregaria]|uniref:uncharacterized protein LOC126335856 n=1 Tax=Schistocerca gregaria TaxID=7010 RepID=UPI00211E1739|nr:uncharacterized protein LOC126335856 [Schistocerca gregaria]